MRVRIISAGKPSYWYACKIGKVFTVKDYGIWSYICTSPKYRYHIIDKSDCVPVKLREVKPEKSYTAALREKLKNYYNPTHPNFENAIKAIVRLNKKYDK